MFDKKFSYHVFIILILLIIAHFIPFERNSLAPDDYSLMNLKNGLSNFIVHPDRPILYIFLEIIHYYFSNNINLYFYFLIFSNFINLIVVYIFFKLFLSSNNSFLVTLIYLIFYIKLEIFHNSIMIHISLVSTLYILFLYFLIKFLNVNNIIYYFLSLLLFLVCIFWYEIGFFISLSIIFYNKTELNIQLKRKIIILIPFLLLMIFYILIRQTGLFGISNFENSYNVNFLITDGFVDIFNHLFGRYAIKNILYGFYQFFNFHLIYIIFFLLFNFFFSYFLITKIKYKRIKNTNLIFFVILFLLCIFPILINGESGGRNYVIATIPISLFIFLLMNLKKINFKFTYFIFIITMLIISQGNAISQAIASRIHNTILLSIENNSSQKKNIRTIIFDPSSLSQHINHSFFSTDYNLINTYYGAQVWETWGLNSYFNTKFESLEFIIVNDVPKLDENKYLISKLNMIKKETLKSELIEISKDGVQILNFDNIYSTGFDYGKNK